jgi:subtilisin
MKRILLGAVAAVGFWACGGTQVGREDSHDNAWLMANGGRVFIVQLAVSSDVDTALEDLSRRHGAPVTQRYRAALHGGALLIPNDAALANVAADPRVVQLDEDQILEAIGRPPPLPAVDAGTSADGGTVNTQKSPTGYTLIGAAGNPNEGAGVRVAVIDTGVDFNHPDLAGQLDLALGKDCVSEAGAALFDNNGHGSHVSGTIAARDNTAGSIGIGTAIKVVPVKVLNRQGSGTWSQIICGIDHVTTNVGAIKVANMSLGGKGTECSTSSCTRSALQTAVENSIAAGVTYAVAAGNDGINAANAVPAAYQGVITVSAYRDANGVLSSDDGWASFTNYGSVVDIAAPGVNIYSTWKNGGYNTISGTSMASPHVAAAAALYLSTHPGLTPQQVRDRLRANAITSYPGSTDAKHAEPLLDVRALTLCTQTCDGLGFNCGSTADGCGGELACGTCGAPSVCTANVCVCTPTVSCASAGATCGTLVDDCGVPQDCGSCLGASVCTAGTCVCTPTITCESAGATCGSVVDECGGTHACGNCSESEACTDNACTPLP